MKQIVWTLVFVHLLLNCKSQDLLPFRLDTLWGYKDKQGTVEIQAQFQYAAKFVGDIAVVAKNDKLGAIDKNERVIIPFRYEFLKPLATEEFLFGNKTKYFGEYVMGVMTKDEKVKIPALYNYISKYNNTYTVTQKKDSISGKSGVGDVRSVKGTYGLYDSNGKVLIPCKYESISWINDSLIDVSAGSLGTSHALFNKMGQQLTGFEYMVFGKFIEGVAKARIGDKFGFIYPTGKVAIPIEFEYCEDFNNGYTLVKQQEKWGAIDKTGKIIIEPRFDYKEAKANIEKKYGR